jgi:hypothetical protein
VAGFFVLVKIPWIHANATGKGGIGPFKLVILLPIDALSW